MAAIYSYHKTVEGTSEFLSYRDFKRRTHAAKKLGYKNVTIIEDGWKKWEVAYPTLQEKNLELQLHGTAEEVVKH